MGKHTWFGVWGKGHVALRGSPGVSASADPSSQRAPESPAVVPWPPPHMPAPLPATGVGWAGLAGLAGSESELANFLLFCVFISHLFNHLLSALSGINILRRNQCFLEWPRPLWWRPSSHLPSFSFLRFGHYYSTTFHLH